MISLGRRDLAAALDYVATNYREDERPGAKCLLLYTLCQDNLELIARVPEILPRDRYVAGAHDHGVELVLERVCWFWIDKDLAAISRYIGTLPDDRFKIDLYTYLASRLGTQHRFKEATEIIGRIPAAERSPFVLEQIALNYQGKNMAEVYTWAAAQESLGSVWIFGGLTRHYLATKDFSNLEIEARLAPDDIKPGIYEDWGRAIVDTKGVEALKYMESLDVKPADRVHMALGGLENAPTQIFDQLASMVFSSNEIAVRREGIGRYVRTLFGRNPQAAIKWVMSSPPELRRESIERLTGYWRSVNAMAALSWLRRLPIGADRDIGLTYFATTMGPMQEESDRIPLRKLALEVAQDISDPEQRERIVKLLHSQIESHAF